jgi:hypothetical protein
MTSLRATQTARQLEPAPGLRGLEEGPWVRASSRHPDAAIGTRSE